MHLVAIPAAAFILLLLLDAFETMILPRRTGRRLSISRVFFRMTWAPVRTVASRFRGESTREAILSFYGPLSLIVLLALWAALLIAAFAALQWSLGTRLEDPRQHSALASAFFFSGETFFTLGLGDVLPTSTLARTLTVIEAGTGFGFLALVIGYLPVLYQSFARREVGITLLDARAGSPPSADELLRRISNPDDLERLLSGWELWAADLLESHLSYPVLGFFRSHHDRQSWVAMLTVMLDTSAVLLASDLPRLHHQARLTFALARHAAVDLAQTLRAEPEYRHLRPLPPGHSSAGLSVPGGARPDIVRLAGFRDMYEPFCAALGGLLALPMPAWLGAAGQPDDWETTARGT